MSEAFDEVFGGTPPTADTDSRGDKDPRGRGPSQASLLVAMAKASCELWHSPGADDSEAYASADLGDGKRATWAISAHGFRYWLAAMFHRKHGRTPNGQALQDALGALVGEAIHAGNQYTPYIRVAGDGVHDVWLDLGDETWQVVHITAAGYRVRPSAEGPRFIRRRGMEALPKPAQGGNWAELRALVNVGSESDWVLLLAWLVGTLRPDGPYPILIVEGEQGSAKSTLCRLLRALMDPNRAALRRPPKEERDLMIAASNSWVMAFDNLSGVPNWMSDCLCSLATGSGFATRELYSNGEEKLFSAARPILCNGIDSPATRPDLLDRSIQVILPTIPDSRRRPEADLWRRFEAVRGRVLGCMLDAVAMALKRQGSLPDRNLPRMADFARWVAAAEPALGVAKGAFLAAYRDARQAAVAQAIEASAIGQTLVAMIEERGYWRGTATDLLAALADRAEDATRRRRDWPANARKMGADLRRLASDLRRIGIEVVTGERTNQRRMIEIEKVGIGPSRPSQASSTGRGDAPGVVTCDGRDDGMTDGDDARRCDRHAGNGPAAIGKGDSGDGDGCDGVLLPFSADGGADPGHEFTEEELLAMGAFDDDPETGDIQDGDPRNT